SANHGLSESLLPKAHDQEMRSNWIFSEEESAANNCAGLIPSSSPHSSRISAMPSPLPQLRKSVPFLSVYSPAPGKDSSSSATSSCSAEGLPRVRSSLRPFALSSS